MLLPTLFLSHGAPNLLLQENSTTRFLSTLSREVPLPKAVLVASAHWVSDQPLVDSSRRPHTIHDFQGFEPELYQRSYPAPGAPEVALRVAHCLSDAGLTCSREERGLDHGAWVPLSLAWPKAELPVLQVSLQPALGAEHHLALGRALAPLAGEGVLVIGSGSATHNLRELGQGEQPVDWARRFDDWLVARCEDGELGALVRYRREAPQAVRNHPTEEHYFPLLVALGAAGLAPRAKVLHRAFMYGSLSMTALRFDRVLGA
jgi:4,5-DOPA dioxygenase extradiol